MIYLLVIEDKHTDPSYVAFLSLEDALEHAEDEFIESLGHYRAAPDCESVHRMDCSKTEGWHYYAALEDAFDITVREVHIKEQL